MKYVLALAMIAIPGIHGAGMALAQSDRDHESTRAYTFGARRHLDTLADRLRREANTICWEMYDNYQHEREFRATYREMYTVLEDSIHIHDLAHDAAHRGTDNEDHIAEDLHEMDRLFHRIEDDIEHWSCGNRYHRHDLSHKMERFETTLHDLMEDYGVRSKRPAPKPPGPTTPPKPPGPGR